MNPMASDADGILSYISDISSELAHMAERTGHTDLVKLLSAVGENAGQRVQINLSTDNSTA